MIGLGLALPLIAVQWRFVLPPLPDGYAFVVDADGAFVVDADGAFLIEEV